MLNNLEKRFVGPYILKEKENIINARVKELNDGIIINMDVG
jgi:hypothetical protein